MLLVSGTLVSELTNFGEIVPGEPAPCALLNVIREDVGGDVQARIDEPILSGGLDGTVKIWNYQTGELLQTLRHFGPVYCLAFSPDGQTLVSGSADTTIKLWHVDS